MAEIAAITAVITVVLSLLSVAVLLSQFIQVNFTFRVIGPELHTDIEKI
jgi:hypothetical protein